MGGNVETAARRTVVGAGGTAVDAAASERAVDAVRSGAVVVDLHGARIARRGTGPVRRRGRAAGPRPVRPGVAPTGVRPSQPARPSGPAGRGPVRSGQRVLVRRPVVLPPHIVRRRRVAAAVGLSVLTLLAVLVLGLLADVAAAARAGDQPVVGPSLTVTVPSSGQGVSRLGG